VIAGQLGVSSQTVDRELLGDRSPPLCHIAFSGAGDAGRERL
jgi:hypothetical protein